MTNILKGKVVVVTGASSGIGHAIALKAAEHGAKEVIVSDVIETPREGGEPTVVEIEKLGALMDAANAFGGVDVIPIARPASAARWRACAATMVASSSPAKRQC
jgi:NAD(P)-dependent dehydrogenase (short-subunit alcohol dehydrogenase family)